MAKQSHEELAEHLREQMGFLRSSASAFDQGKESEANRLAAILRVLLHNTKKSMSLLKQLGVQHQLKFLDTKERPVGARPGVITKRWDAGLVAIQLGPDRPTFKAPLEVQEGADIYGPQPFRQWWNRDILEDENRVRFSRKEFVLFMAHQVGGVHVDPEIKPHFAALTKLNSLGFSWSREGTGTVLGVPGTSDQEPMGNPIPTNVRQIAYEVEYTINEQLAHMIVAP